MPIRIILLVLMALYQAIASWREDRQQSPGQLIDIGGYKLHFDIAGAGNPTIVLDHSLGGIEGYFLLEELSQLTQVFVYDRAGYGWSDRSPYPRTSRQIAQELDRLLTQAQINPPYILIGNSFGSYNARLYAYLFPHKVAGIVLTDGLHETGMLSMPLQLKALQLFFVSGFVMSVFGSILGIIRLLKVCKLFELLKPELRHCSQDALGYVQRSFCRPKHWITMAQEMINLGKSGRQVSLAKNLGNLPVVSIKASSFFKPTLWTKLIPLHSANQLREKMHLELSTLSTDFVQLEASKTGHFVWLDRSDVMIDAVKMLLNKINSSDYY